MQLHGKRIIVTGSASGIGAGTVRAYVREGAHVSAMDIDDEAGNQVVNAANAEGAGAANYYHCNIASPEEVFSSFNAAAQEMGGLDVLCHIAAIENFNAAEDFSVDQMRGTWDVNINGTILTNQAACHLMKQEASGAIINFASDVALAGMPGSALYATSKGAVLSWTRTIAHEWASKFNIRCNCVNPTMKTPMYDQYLATLTPEELARHQASEKQQVPLGGSMGDVDRDMAPVMVFLASDGSRFVNGQIICVNGGRNMLRG
jgi:NAD(P)-dependent dehydrogenase (short-subunit alcohol dehydrogenase family)